MRTLAMILVLAVAAGLYGMVDAETLALRIQGRLGSAGSTSDQDAEFRLASRVGNGLTAGPRSLAQGAPGTRTRASEADDKSVISEFRLLGSTPNPAHDRASIAYELPVQTAVNVRIYDVSGRLVRVLRSDPGQGPGRHAVSWDGRDRGGARVSSGVYFYRLEAGAFRKTGRMVLLK